MIFELDKNDFKKILSLYLKEETVFPLILAVIKQKQRGWVFVDNPVYPTSAVVITNFGFMQFIGTKNFSDNYIEFLKYRRIHIPSYLLWYSPPSQIQKKLDRLAQEHVRRRKRMRFIFNKQIVIDPIKCPTGFTVCLLDKDLIGKAVHFKLDISSRFWASVDDFLEHGIGACVMKDNEIVSLCYSACIVDDLAEIDVVTQKEYRGMGLAGVAAQFFISECIRRGIKPTWDCFIDNTASMKLAEKLGFEERQTYLFYSFNIPINLLEYQKGLTNEMD